MQPRSRCQPENVAKMSPGLTIYRTWHLLELLPLCSELFQLFAPITPLEKFGVKVRSVTKGLSASFAAQTDAKPSVLEEAEGAYCLYVKAPGSCPAGRPGRTSAFPFVVLSCREELRVWKQTDQGSSHIPVSSYLSPFM